MGGTAQRVRELRHRLGLTQQKTAARLGVTSTIATGAAIFPTITGAGSTACRQHLISGELRIPAAGRIVQRKV
jgi:transcriptional regulator with XRE-family HTH domain